MSAGTGVVVLNGLRFRSEGVEVYALCSVVIPVVSRRSLVPRRSLVRWTRSVDEDDGKLHVFPDEIPVKRLVFLRRWRRQREMTTLFALLLRF
ncbi:hypothetical protein F2Q70_00000257 [Brassica cretica]|uniref:Uncharacterized protein n=1 Tax=Brassica cretica TaxID=69181 RepID=A0A8S9INX6_BRACR|nr:hypothetical protein F2Q70_00000257 [Brassica cretica]